MRLTQIQPAQQPIKCRSTDLHHLLLRIWPTKNILFQSFHPDAKTVVRPVQDFDDIPLAVAESEQVAGKKIEVELIRYQQAKSIDRLAHVGAANGDIYLRLGG